MHAIIDDFAWIFIGLAVITVLFVICVAFIFLDEGLRLLFRAVRQRRAGFSAQTQATPTSLPAARSPLKNPAESSREDKPVSGASLPQVLVGIWRALQAKLRTAAEGTHMPFRLGHR